MITNVKAYIQELGEKARLAQKTIALAPSTLKNKALGFIAKELAQNKNAIIAANQKDLNEADKNGLEAALKDRLTLDEKSIDQMIKSLEQIMMLPDPIGEITNMRYQPSGIQVGKMRVPLGVIGMIYESRPNVTQEAAALCIKSGNVAILKGGKEAIHSNKAILSAIHLGLREAQLPIETVQLIETTDRQAVTELIQMSAYVDVIIPRGGKGLIEKISQESRIPVIKHLDGICHVFIDESADKEKAIKIAFNAKTQRYGTCNTMETLLIHEAIAQAVLPELIAQYLSKNVELRGCIRTQNFSSEVILATEEDWKTEYLAPILSVRIVNSLEEAISHIAQYSSQHTDAIVTENWTHAQKFLKEVDSSSVMVNASTRFADGFEYGLGAEIGISTDKFHARGPVGLEGLTSQKFIVLGDGHIRQ